MQFYIGNNVIIYCRAYISHLSDYKGRTMNPL